mmetsp:Transcript_8825/g.17810  ORF Transcript_8825/g.17810 Transcript_8825/m.17810 type:complete len:278 (-) Transcript_8825:231-1064(-)
MIHHPLDVPLQPTAKVLEHGRAPREHDVFVQAAATVDGGSLDCLVDDQRHGGRVVRVGDLRVEEDLRPEEALVRHVTLPRPGELRLAIHLLGPLCGVVVVLAELLRHVRAHIAVLLLDPFSHLHGVVRRDGGLAFPHKQLDEVGDVAPREGDVLDARADHVTVRDGNNVCHAVTSVDHRAGERALDDLLRGPRRSQSEDRLHGDVQPLDVERLEHDLGRELSILRSVHRRLGQQEVVILRVASKILEDAAVPVSLHVVPVLDDAVADGVVDRVIGGS